MTENSSQTNEIKISDPMFEETLDKTLFAIREAVILSDQVQLQHLLEFSNGQSSKFSILVNEYYQFCKETTEKAVKDSRFEGDMPAITPYYTYDEYVKLCKEVFNEDVTMSPFEYAFLDNPKKYFSTIHHIRYIRNQISFDNDSYREQCIRLGWDPDIMPTSTTCKIARERQLKWFRENYDVDIIHLEDYTTENEVEYEDNKITDEMDSISEAREANNGKVLEPVYIVLQYAASPFGKLVNWWTKADWSHAGLSFDSSLDYIYSFNAHHYFRHGETNKLGGFSVESLKDTLAENYEQSKIALLAIFVPSNMKKKILKTLDFWKKHAKDTKYDFGNLVNIMTNKSKETGYSMAMVCSQFVDNILKLSNIDITGKNSNLVVPGDYIKLVYDNQEPNSKVRIYELYNGFAKDFKPSIIRRKIEVLKHRLSYNRMVVFDPKQVKLESYSLDNLSEAMIELIKPTTIFTEYKLPFSFDKVGNLTIALPKDLQREYNEAHRLLSMYDVSNIDAMKHELARLFYINSIIEYKLKKTKRGTKEYKELEDLRARVLNDFTTYFKVVKSADRNFDFNTYFSKTEYYTKNIEIDNDTIQYSSRMINKLLKTMI